MRRAEIIMAVVMGICSVGLMFKSAELPIGWIPDEGPGGGFFPFWLAVGMLLSCVWIAVNWFRRATVPARSEQPFMTPGTLPLILTAAGSLTAMILAIHYIGVYLAMPLFLLFYMRVLGRHGLALCIATAILMPVVTFVFFELMLNIALPKGITEEPVFVPIFDWYYQQLG